MELTQYLALARRWWWLIVIAAAVGGGSAFALTERQPDEYRATARLLVVQQALDGVVQINDLQTSERLAATFARLVTLRPVLEDAIETGQFPLTPMQLEARLTVVNPEETNLLEITARSTDPNAARDYANIVAQVFTQSSEAQVAADTGEVRIVESAIAPEQPEAKLTILNTAAGLVIGVFIAATVAVVLERLRDRVRTAADLTAVGFSVLGRVRQFNPGSAPRDALCIVHSPDSREAEEFRALRTSLLARLQSRAGDRTVALQVASAGPEDGKSTIAANVALALGLTGRRVIIVDADLRRPSLHSMFEVAGEPGMTSLLIDGDDLHARLSRAIVSTDYPNLDLLPAGRGIPNPSEALSSDRVGRIFDELRSRYDVVIADSPPLLTVTDGYVLARAMDAVIMVARPERTSRSALAEIRSELEWAGQTPIGIVLNRAPQLEFGASIGPYHAEYSATPVGEDRADAV